MARDRGISLTEVLVTVVLLGTTVTAVLGALMATARASSTDREHATAYAWLQSASDEIHRAPRVPCTSGRQPAIDAYTLAAQSATRPPLWASSAATLDVTDVEYLGRADVDDQFSWSQSFCFEGPGYESSPLYTQRVTLRVVSETGRVIETVEVVKSE